jgi:hypothetical protein
LHRAAEWWRGYSTSQLLALGTAKKIFFGGADSALHIVKGDRTSEGNLTPTLQKVVSFADDEDPAWSPAISSRKPSASTRLQAESRPPAS